MEKQWLPRSWQASTLQESCSSIFCSTGRCYPKCGFTEFLFNWVWSTATVYLKLHTKYILIILATYRIIVRAPRESTSLDRLDQTYWRFTPTTPETLGTQSLSEGSCKCVCFQPHLQTCLLNQPWIHSASLFSVLCLVPFPAASVRAPWIDKVPVR